MTPKIENLGQNLTPWDGNSRAKKVIFWYFSKLFWNYLGSVWALLNSRDPLLQGPPDALLFEKSAGF